MMVVVISWRPVTLRHLFLSNIDAATATPGIISASPLYSLLLVDAALNTNVEYRIGVLSFNSVMIFVIVSD
jgi:hypothetical protein